MLLQAMHGTGNYVFTMSPCADVCPIVTMRGVNIGIFFLNCVGGNHYNQQMK